MALRFSWLLPILFVVMGNAVAERLPIKTYTTGDGLARDHINRIVQDSRGYLWFCTSEGLSRFDGYAFANYGTEQGLASRQVTDFLETRTGIYWAATDRGLCRFAPEALSQESRLATGSVPQRFRIYYPGGRAGSESINAIYEDHAGTIWCATLAGLYRVDQSGGEPVFSLVDIIQPAPAADNRLRIESVLEDRQRSLWIVAQSGLYRVRANGVPNGTPNGAIDRFTAESAASVCREV